MPIEKRSKEERTKSAGKVRKAIYTTTPSHGKPGAWGKVPGTFEVEILEPELEIVEIVQEMALEEELEPITEEKAEEIIAEHAEVGIKVIQDGDVLRVVEPAKEPVEAEPEPIIETADALVGTVKKVLETVLDGLPKEEPKVDNTAEIEALKAKLAELEK